jgi:HrpA-like RNA helicase
MPNVLVFLPSIPEIKRVLEKRLLDEDFKKIQEKTDYRFEEFHGALRPDEKNAVLDPKDDLGKTVRIILATNIAETAVTINNVMYVLDSGKEREYYQNELTSLSYMRTENISKSSAIQRAGRAGRVCNGYCYRMYNEKEYEEFQDSKKPEIIRMDISDIVLLNIELKEFFKISDLLFYEQIQDKTTAITMMLKGKGCISSDEDSGVDHLSFKGKFMIEADLEPATSMFLYECARLNNAHYGCMAALVLEKPVGYFRNNETLSKILKLEIKVEKMSSQLLGDLAPIIFLLEKYNNLSNDEKKKYEKDYGVGPADMRRMTNDLRKITK